MTLTKLTSALALAAALLAPSFASADDKMAKDKPVAVKPAPPAKLSADDLATIAHVHAVNGMEIDMGKLAQKNGSSAGVKAFGDTLVKDHTASDKDLTAFAKKRGAVIPADKPQTDADKQAMKDDMDGMAKLKTMKGADFDRQFLAMMVAGHEREIGKLETAIGKTTDDELSGLLKGNKPVMQGHATSARDLQKNTPAAAATK